MTLIWLTNEETVYSLIARGWEIRRIKQGIDYRSYLLKMPWHKGMVVKINSLLPIPFVI